MSYPQHRRDIDGLRGIAILAVLLFHAFPALIPGGYVGVDIFFVISGYLITGIVLRDIANKQFRLRHFYARRIRRIFPALIVVLAGVWLAGWFILFPEEYAELGKHIAASSVFISNIVLWKEAGYFDRSAELKPLLHLWSLGVEEQFYIFWPAIMLVLSRIPARIALALAALFFASLCVNLVTINSAPSGTFFLLPTRFWQLLIGGMLAYAEQRKPTSRANASVFSLLGFGLIALAIVGFSEASAYPGWRAIIPTLGAALILMAGSHCTVNKHLLSGQVLVWFGAISYPLYLWHWPLLAYSRILHAGEPSAITRIVAIAFAMILAWLTYRLLEQPIRFGRYAKSRVAIRNALLILLALGVLGTLTWQAKGLANLRSFNKELKRDTEKLDASLANQPRCAYPFRDAIHWCMLSSNRPPTLAIVGDSHAHHLFPGVAADRNHSWLLIGHSSCPPLDGIAVRYRNKPDECVERNEKITQALIATPSIKTIILSARGMAYMSNTNLLPATKGRNDIAHWQNESRYPDEKNLSKPELFYHGLNRTIERFKKAGKNVIVFLDIPELDFQPTRCIPRPITLLAPPRTTACSMPKSIALNYAAPYREAIQKLAAKHPQIRVYDPTNQLCDKDRCYAGNEHMLFYRDSNHLSQRGSQKVMADFIQWLDK